jgi:SPP1 family phage portal protein
MIDNIIEIIKKDLKEKKDKYIGNKYYNYDPKTKNDIEIDVVDKNGNIKTIKIEKGCNIYVNYFKMLVNQKIDYLLAKEPTIKSKLPYTTAVVTDMLETLMLKASLDSISWLHFYVENNRLDWIMVHDSEIIPIYDSYHKNIIEIIRYYSIDKDTLKVEDWTETGVDTALIKKEKINGVEQELIQAFETMKHFETTESYQGQIIDTSYDNFETIPFIPLFNNKDKNSDLDEIRDLVDYYNSISSGFIANIEAFQEAVTKLKGFSGDEKNLRETMAKMKKYKAVGVPQDGDIEYMVIEIPVEARKVLLDILKDNIFLLGRGVDPNKLGDGNITNVVIKSRYANLDMKCNTTEKQLRLFYESFINFINGYYNSNYDTIIECNKSLIINTSELINDCVNAIDLITAKILSKQTLMQQIIWIVDVDKEKKLIEEESKLEENDLKNDLEALKAFNNKNSGQNPPNENSGQNLSNAKGE